MNPFTVIVCILLFVLNLSISSSYKNCVPFDASIVISLFVILPVVFKSTSAVSTPSSNVAPPSNEILSESTFVTITTVAVSCSSSNSTFTLYFAIWFVLSSGSPASASSPFTVTCVILF